MLMTIGTERVKGKAFNLGYNLVIFVPQKQLCG